MRLRLRSRPGWLWAAVLSGLLLHGGSAAAESRITSAKRTWSQEHGPPGAQCAWLETGLYAPERRGDIADLPRGSFIARLLCPTCLDEPRYGVETPLRQIEQQIPPLAEDEARFDCTEHCPRWLRCAFVSTNSACQGQRASAFWVAALEQGLRIHFARVPFKWKNLAKNNAGVTVVVIGITSGGTGRHLFVYSLMKRRELFAY